MIELYDDSIGDSQHRVEFAKLQLDGNEFVIHPRRERLIVEVKANLVNLVVHLGYHLQVSIRRLPVHHE